MKPIAYVGVDYHIKSVTIAVYLPDEKAFYDTIRLTNKDSIIRKYVNKLSEQFDLKLCYEASGSGYVFQRKMQVLGYHCDVIAPSLILKKSGNRRKNDYRDARNLAQQYAGGQLTVVHPPSEKQESVRNLMRCRMALKESQKRVKQQINSFVLSRDCRWGKSKWTIQHRTWLSGLFLSDSCAHSVLQEYLGLLDYLESRIKHLDQQIELLAQSEIYAESVKRLRTLKGIGTLTAMVLITEITDFRRFSTPRALMSFLGLIPGEKSSGETNKPVPITRTGNHRCRTLLIESVYHYIKKPRIGPKMKEAFGHVDPKTAMVATKCMHRLHKRYWALALKGKTQQKALVAIAREFVGFIWAIMQPPELLVTA